MLGCIEILHPFLDRFWDFVSSMDQTKIPNHCFLKRFVDAGFGCHRKHFSCLCSDVGLANIVIHSFRLKHSYAIAKHLSSPLAEPRSARCCRVLAVGQWTVRSANIGARRKTGCQHNTNIAILIGMAETDAKNAGPRALITRPCHTCTQTSGLTVTS